jgi:transcriptional regulator GlxA family with amidase domain
MDSRIYRVIALMGENLQREQSLAALAQAVNISPSRLYHLFKAETGTTPTHYLQTLRMRRAKYLLETTFLRVKEIGMKVGINGDSHFVRDFKLAYGMTPAQYRADYWSAFAAGIKVPDGIAKSGSR